MWNESLQQLPVCAEMDRIPDAHHRPTDEPRLLKHQVYQGIPAEILPMQTEFREGRAPEAEHLRRRTFSKQLSNFTCVKRVFKKIPFMNFHVVLRKKLLRLTTGGSSWPAVETNVHGILLLYYQCVETAALYTQRCHDVQQTEALQKYASGLVRDRSDNKVLDSTLSERLETGRPTCGCR
jgi:hypothetical protein